MDDVRYVGGTDISFVKGSDEAMACLSVLEFPSLKVVGTIMEKIEMKEPYISGYLAFREQPPLQALLDRMRREGKLPEPDVWLVDGNGQLHPRRCGLACHFGVEANVRTVGVGKNFLHVDGVTKDGVAAAISKHLLDAPPPHDKASEEIADGSEAKESGTKIDSEAASPSEAAVEGQPVPKLDSDVSEDALVIRSLEDGETPLCTALLSGKSGSKRPIFVSVGHRVSLDTATELVRRCCKHRMPEPVRAADLGSREALRQEAVSAQAEATKVGEIAPDEVPEEVEGGERES